MKAYRFCSLLFLLLFSLNCISALAQSPAWQWVENNNLPSRNELSVAQDGAGNFYAGGYDSATYVITKHNSNGILLWTKTIARQTNQNEIYIRTISTDAAGNIYLAGYFSGAVQIDAIAFSSGAFRTIFTAKLNNSGIAEWVRNGPAINISPTDVPSAGLFTLKADSAGNVYVSGYANQATNFGSIAWNPAAGQFFQAKYNLAGQIEWVENRAEPSYSIAIGRSGNYFCTDGFSVRKYNPNGLLLWQTNGPAPNPDSYLMALHLDEQDNCYTTGNFIQDTAFGNDTLAVSGNGSTFLVKYNSAGNQLWAKASLNPSGAGFCIPKSVSTNSQGQVFITGFFDSTASFGNNTGSLISNLGTRNLFVAGFSAATGDAHWVKQATSPILSDGIGIFGLPSGECVVAGNYDSGCSFDNYNLTGNGFFLAKLAYSPLGTAEKISFHNFRLYPNPANSEIIIKSGLTKQGTLEIFNLTGHKVLTTRSTSEIRANVAKFPAGLYLVKITSEGQTETQKLIVTH